MMIKNSSFIAHHSSLSLKAPAKINWFLKVLGLRNDGFHEIRSLMQKISLYDILTFSPSNDLTLQSDTSIPVEQNLVYRAALLLKNTCGIDKGALITLNKNIPAGAGLGGGSSDAASTLLGLNKLWSLDLPTGYLCNIAEQLGSDVPFFLYGPIASSHGRGEKITPCKIEKSVNLLLVKPPFPVSTAWVYGEYKNRRQNTEDRSQDTGDQTCEELTKKDNEADNIELLVRLIEKAEFGDLADILTNDLESVTIKSFPVISEIKNRLKEQGAIFSMMSGSGPAVFGIFRSTEEAEKASKAFKDYWTMAVQTLI
jgi:4-diphosphocytidyl-2-C-methyl-D-erythritol kinase